VFYRIIRDCLIVADFVINVKLLSVYTEKKSKAQSCKRQYQKTGKDFSANCKEVGKSILDVMKKEETTVCCES